MEQLEQLLAQFLVPDNAQRKQAEEHIKQLGRDPGIVPALMHLVSSSQQPNIRQLAAVLLRKRITGHWMKLSEDVKTSIKSVLLEIIVHDSSSPVRRACADVVSVVAKHTVPAGQWPALLPFLMQCSQSQEEDHREVSLMLFSSLTETIGEMLLPHFGSLQAVFLRGLQDSQSGRVRLAALKAVGSLVEYVEDEQEVMKMRELIGPILEVARHCIAHGEEEAALRAFEIFDDLVESPAPILGPALPAIFTFALEVAANTTLELATRNQAAQMVGWMARWKPKAVQKHRLAPPALAVLLPLLAEADAHAGDTAADVPASAFAGQVVDVMCQSLPSKAVLPSVLAFAHLCSGSAAAREREAGLVALAISAEGYSEVLKKKLLELVPLVLKGLADGEQRVRGAACFALGQLAEYVQPEMSQQYELVLPAIFRVLHDPNPEAQEKAYYALATFCENLGEEIVPYLAALMQSLLEGLNRPQRDLQDMCLSALGSAAAAAGTAFAPYMEATVQRMVALVQLEGEAELGVRARAFELVAIIATAAGRPAADAFLPHFVAHAFKNFEKEHSELREYTHSFFGSVAELLGADFSPYLEQVVAAALATCSMDDGMVFDVDGDSDDDDDAGGGGRRASGLDAFSSDDEEGSAGAGADGKDGEERGRNVSIRTGVLDEKAAATQALGLYALHTKAAFRPYIEKTAEVLRKHAGYFHEDVRLQAMSALQYLMVATREAFPAALTGGTHQLLSPEANRIFEMAMGVYLRAVEEDDDKETVAQACTAMGEVIRLAGPVYVHPYAKRVCDAVLSVLQGEAMCQVSADDEADQALEDEEGEGEGSEHEEVLLDAATELLPALASALGPSLAPLFQGVYPALAKFMKAARPAGERTTAIAAIAEVGKEIGAAIAPYCSDVLPVVVRELRDEDAANRRNAAFCAGVLCQHGADKAIPFYNNLLVALHPLFGEDEEDAVRDNGVGAVARMISAQPLVVPLEQVLPVMVRALPLREDHEEAAPVYGALCSLISASHPQILPLIPQLVPIFAQVATTPEVSAEVKHAIGAAMRHLVGHFAAETEAIVGTLPQEQAAALASFMPPPR